MTIATVLSAFCLCIGVCLAADKDAKPVFACNLKAISAAERPRYNEPVNHIRAAIRDRSEISSGYAFKLNSKIVTLPEAAEWVAMERLCCPFLTLQLSASGDMADWGLTLTGATGIKQLIAAEFPI